MESGLNSVIIGAVSGIAGATITQVATWILASQNYKRELKKEYKLNKVNAYKRLFIVFSELTYDLSSIKERNLDAQSLFKIMFQFLMK